VDAVDNCHSSVVRAGCALLESAALATVFRQLAPALKLAPQPAIPTVYRRARPFVLQLPCADLQVVVPPLGSGIDGVPRFPRCAMPCRVLSTSGNARIGQ
jgi:hypothetical protein